MHGQAPRPRFPRAVRPWQHVLDCLNGYLTLVGFAVFVAYSESVGHLVDHRFGTVAGSLVTVVISRQTVLFAFVMHRRFVFRVRGHVLRDLVRFESVYLRGDQPCRLACAGRAGPASHPGASNHRGGHHATELLRPPALFISAQCCRHSGRDVAHVEGAAASDEDDAEFPTNLRDELPTSSITYAGRALSPKSSYRRAFGRLRRSLW